MSVVCLCLQTCLRFFEIPLSVSVSVSAVHKIALSVSVSVSAF